MNNDEDYTMDMFDEYEKLPLEVQAILDKYSEMDNGYEECRNLVQELESVGYTCQYGLDGIPFYLKVKKCPCCNSMNTKDDNDNDFHTINNCNDCGAEFLNDGEVTLNPKDYD